MGLFNSLTGGGGFSSSETGDAISGVGGVHLTFGAPPPSPFRPSAFPPALLIGAALIVAALLWKARG